MTFSPIACAIAAGLMGLAARAGLKACTTAAIAQTAVVQTFRSAQIARDAPPTDAAVRGRALYLKFGCYQCHGRQGQGSSAGPRLAPGPMALAGLTRYVRRPRGEMPPYTVRVVTDRELADIHAYLQSIARPPAIATLPFDR